MCEISDYSQSNLLLYFSNSFIWICFLIQKHVNDLPFKGCSTVSTCSPCHESLKLRIYNLLFACPIFYVNNIYILYPQSLMIKISTIYIYIFFVYEHLLYSVSLINWNIDSLVHISVTFNLCYLVLQLMLLKLELFSFILYINTSRAIWTSQHKHYIKMTYFETKWLFANIIYNYYEYVKVE